MRNLLSLPTELLSSILSYLQCYDLLTCSLICKQIYRLISDSSLFQYTITLHKYRFLDIVPPSQNIPFSTRLRVLKQREEAWKKLEWKGRHTLKLPPTGSVYEFVGGIYGNGREDDNRVTASISFLELPLTSSECGESVESRNDGDGEKSLLRTWTHAMGDVAIIDFTMDPSQNLLVLVALAPPDSKYVYNLHLRTISTNQPHPKAPLPILPCLERHPTIMTTPELFTAVRVQVSGDLVGLLIKDAPDNVGAHLEIWNWYSDPHYSCSMSSMAGIDDFTFLSHSAFLVVLPIGRFEVYSFPDPLTSSSPTTNPTADTCIPNTSPISNTSSTTIPTTSHATSLGPSNGTTNATTSLGPMTSTSLIPNTSPFLNGNLAGLGHGNDTVTSSSCKNHRGCHPIRLYAYDFPELSNGYMYWYISMSCNPAPGYVPRSGFGSSSSSSSDGNMKKGMGEGGVGEGEGVGVSVGESGIKTSGGSGSGSGSEDEDGNEDDPFPPYNSQARTLFQRQAQSQSQSQSQSVGKSSSSNSGYEGDGDDERERERERRKKENQKQIYYPLPDERIHACCVYIFNPNNHQGPGAPPAPAPAPAPATATAADMNANAGGVNMGSGTTGTNTGPDSTPVAVASTVVGTAASTVTVDTATTTSSTTATQNGNFNSGIGVSTSNAFTPMTSTTATTASSSSHTHINSASNLTSTSNGDVQDEGNDDDDDEGDDGLDEDNNQVHSFVFFLNLKMLLHPPEEWIHWKEIQKMKKDKAEMERIERLREMERKQKEREQRYREQSEKMKDTEDLFSDLKKSLGPLWKNSTTTTMSNTSTRSTSSSSPVMTYAKAVSSGLEVKPSTMGSVGYATTSGTKLNGINHGFVNVQNGSNHGSVRVPVGIVDNDFLPHTSSTSSSSTAFTNTNNSPYPYTPFPKFVDTPSASGSGSGVGNGNGIITNRNMNSRSKPPILIVDESASGSQGQGRTEYSSTIPLRRSRSGSSSHSQAWSSFSSSSSGTFVSGSGSGGLESANSSSSSSSLSTLNQNNISTGILHPHTSTSFTSNNQPQTIPCSSSSSPPPALLPPSPYPHSHLYSQTPIPGDPSSSQNYSTHSAAHLRARATKTYKNSLPIPWDVWGPTSTRWFEECLSTDWQHAIYGLRTVESVSVKERQKALERERMRTRLLELKQKEMERRKKDDEGWKIRLERKFARWGKEMREIEYEFSRDEVDVIMGDAEEERNERKRLIDFEGKRWKTVTTKKRTDDREEESSQHDDFEDNNAETKDDDLLQWLLGYEVDNAHNIVYSLPQPSTSTSAPNTNGRSLTSTSNHSIDTDTISRTLGRRRPKRFLRVRDFNPYIIAETEAEIKRYDMLRVKGKPSRVHIENGDDQGQSKWKGKQRATPLYPMSISTIPIHLNINTNITSPPPPSSSSSSSPSSLLLNQNQNSSLPNGQFPYSVPSSSGITTSPFSGNSSTAVFGIGTGNNSSYIPPPSSSSSSIPISTLPLTDVSGENGYSIPILPYSNNASSSSPLLFSPSLTLSTITNRNRTSTVRKLENPKPKVWSKRRVVREPSVTPVKGVFKKDIVSLLPYAEVVSEETFEVTDVMMDDCRLLLLKRGQMGKLENVEVLMM